MQKFQSYKNGFEFNNKHASGVQYNIHRQCVITTVLGSLVYIIM